MLNFFINLISPILVTAGVSIIAVLVKPVGDAAINFLATKKEEVEQSKFVQDHQQQLATAKEVWGIVDEHFRITQTLESTIQSKSQMFDELLLKKVPGLTQEELDYLRQTIAGEVNKGKEALKDDKVKQLQDQLVSQAVQIQDQQNTIATLTQKIETAKQNL